MSHLVGEHTGTPAQQEAQEHIESAGRKRETELASLLDELRDLQAKAADNVVDAGTGPNRV